MSTIHFRDQDWTVILDADAMSFEEMEQMEAALNMAWGMIESKSKGENVSMAVIRAMMWIGLKRDIPDLTFEETAKIKMSDITNQGVDENPLETPGGSTNQPDSPE